jgi:hypothetical protein
VKRDGDRASAELLPAAPEFGQFGMWILVGTRYTKVWRTQNILLNYFPLFRKI